MEIEEFILWTTTNAGYSALRVGIVSNCEWLFHETRATSIASISATGLEPRYPGGTPFEPAIDAFGENSRKLLCFSSQLGGMNLGNGLDLIRPLTIGVRNTDFPKIAALDWSFPDLILMISSRIEGILTPQACVPIAVKVMTENHSVSFYDGVAPDKLRVCPNDDHLSDPNQWPLLFE